MNHAELRPEHHIIADWISEGARVLDLGCGDGAFLAALQQEKGVTGYGIEIDPDNIVACIDRGVNVIHSNLDQGLSDFEDDYFDHVIMTQTVQAMRFPHLVIEEILRIGREGIITCPNMGYWKCRLQFVLGQMPITRHLPNTWYDTPNIHFCTVKDFEALCEKQHIRILQRTVQVAPGFKKRTSGWLNRAWPNLFAAYAIYHVTR